MDLHLAQTVSSAFLEAYRRCMDEEKAKNPQYFMAMPAIVCAAFSIEVGLKTILSREGKPANGHNMLKLFKQISTERQYEIYELTGMEMQEFAAHLNHSQMAFTKWRYIYEESAENHISVAFLGKLAHAVEAVSLGIKNAA